MYAFTPEKPPVITSYSIHYTKLYDIQQTEHMIGVGGTFRALSNAIMKQQNYPLDKLHGYTFDAALMVDFGEKILKASENELKELGIKPERFDIIKSGTLILLRIIKRFNITRLTTSGAGVREGVRNNFV